jgi:cell wall-associated NlpC family hydrolase
MNDRPNDREICENLLGESQRHGGGRPPAELVVWAGRRFLGAPYQADTLEDSGPEQTVVNLHSFDCVTFVETALALALSIRAGRRGFAAYAEILERIRYRSGRCNGYPSRLHYFTDWLFDAGRKGIVRDITAALGGVPSRRRLHALTDRRAEIPQLADPAVYRRMRVIEGICSRRGYSRIPREAFTAAEPRIAAGDLVAIATDREGLDVSHVGIAVRIRGALHLLHASSAAGRVLVTEGTLLDYLWEKPSCTGVVIGRLLAATL